MARKTVLMIEDDPFYLEIFASELQDDFDVIKATGIEQGRELMAANRPAVVLLDISLTADDPHKVDRSGLEFLAEVKQLYPELPVVMVTGIDSISVLREASATGADAYFVKTEKMSTLREIMHSLALPPARKSLQDGEPIAVSATMRKVLQDALRIAASREDVLITGESGVGKEVLAHYIHRHSDRSDQSFVAINMGELDVNLFSEELVGHERGAFTGAHRAHGGLLETAGGGIVFLDEIGDMPAENQVKLLRLVETKVIRRIGATREIKLDVRIISATNQSLEVAVRRGRFRKDLYHRLKRCDIHIPPLREREEDIIPLARHFLKAAALRNARPEKRLAPSALLQLKNHEWEGNVRELMNVMTRAFIACPFREITASHLSLESVDSEPILPFRLARKRFERQHIKRAVTVSSGNVSAAATLLGISRQALIRKMKQFQLDLNERERDA